jgi:hypothetical protein
VARGLTLSNQPRALALVLKLFAEVGEASRSVATMVVACLVLETVNTPRASRAPHTEACQCSSSFGPDVLAVTRAAVMLAPPGRQSQAYP